MINSELNNKSFVDWAKQVKKNVRSMTATLYEAGLIIDETTEKYIPIDWGYLIRSYEGNIFDNYPKIELEVSYTGRHSPRFDGFDYAWIQHEKPFNHTHGTDHYLKKGLFESKSKVFELIERDYISCFGLRL